VPPIAVLALVLLAVWLLLAAGLRTLIQLRRTGEVSVPRFRDRPGSPQWWARLLSALGFACAVAAPLAELEPALQTCQTLLGTVTVRFWAIASDGEHQASVMAGVDERGGRFLLSIGSLTKQ
jgi:hypothetical protein